MFVKMGFVLILSLLFMGRAHGFSVEQYVNAIYKVENSKKHPYGIMVKYKKTTPRQACFNTVKHKLKDWVAEGKKGTFEHYLAVRYAPIGAANDPKGLNKNWERNLIAILKRDNYGR